MNFMTKRAFQKIVNDKKFAELEAQSGKGPQEILKDEVDEDLLKLVHDKVLYLNDKIGSMMIDSEFNKLYGIAVNTKGDLDKDKLAGFCRKHNITWRDSV